jgi:hypothetical protein
MIMTKEAELLKAENHFREMVDFIDKAVQDGLRIDETECGLLRGAWKVCLALLHAFVAAHGDGDVGETLEVPGRSTPLRRLPDKHWRRYCSIFGDTGWDRYVYGSRECQRIEYVPLDARLGLPAGDFSYVLEDWSQRLCVKEAFGEAGSVLDNLLGASLCVRTLEAMNQRVSAEVETFQATQAPPPAAEEGEFLVATSDCKGVPMCRPKAETPTPTHRRKKGEKANKKQMACVGAVYSIDPFVRSADDILDEVMRHKRGTQRPKPQHKRLWAELTRKIDGEVRHAKDAVFGAMSDDLCRRNRGVQRPVIFLGDGERALWEHQRTYVPWAIGILDLFHVLEYLWSAAHCLHREGTDEAQAFVNERLRALLEGKVKAVITGLRSLSRRHARQRSTLRRVANYFANNQEHMRYDEYLAKVYPIGSGVAEGACRHLVKDRMEQTGMHWKIPGAQAMLYLRAIYLNGEWENYMAYRIAKEQQELYHMGA